MGLGGGAALPRFFLAAALAAGPAAGAGAARHEVRRVILAGDSTMAARTGYGQAFCALFAAGLDCVNLARGGRSTRSFREDGSWERVRALLAYREAATRTVVLVQFGHNDQPGKPGRSTELADEYPANLERYVDEIRAAGARPVLVTPLSRRKFREGGLDDDLRPWAGSMSRVAKARDVPLVDLHAASVRELRRMGPVEADTLAMPPPDFDRTHVGAKGAAFFAQLMARDLVGVVPDLASRLATRPQLNDRDAGRYSVREVLGPWDPLADARAGASPPGPDFIADASSSAGGGTTFASLQAAVDAAVARGEVEATGRRIRIGIRPGTYAGPVYVPETAAPITLAGEGAEAADVRIVATIAAGMAGTAHREAFAARFAGSGPRVRDMAASLRDRERVGTSGSAVVWVRGEGFEATNLTIENAYNRAGPDGPRAMQAVALFVDGADRARFERVRLLGLQDTLYLRAPAPGRLARSYFDESLIEGDVDFIFGDGTAFFRRSEIRTRGTRDVGYALAPGTHVSARHGFVFDECRFTHDGSDRAMAGRHSLARQWFRGQRCTPYEPAPAIPGYACRLGPTDAFDGTTGTISREPLAAVGKVAILRSRIGAHIDRLRPWADWNAPGTRQYRPVQYHASRWRSNLEVAGIDATKDLGLAPSDVPDGPFLAEYRNEQD